MTIKLSDELKYWRAERPSEGKMDEFISKAEVLESKLIPDTNYAVFSQVGEGDYEQLTHWDTLDTAVQMSEGWYDKTLDLCVMGRVFNVLP